MIVVRTLVYEGHPNWIRETMMRNNVKGLTVLQGGKIFEAIVGFEYPTAPDPNSGQAYIEARDPPARAK